MKLNPDWKRIVKKAWSFKLLAAAALLTACEVALPLVGTEMPPLLFSGLSGVVIVGAMIMRIVVQKDYDK
jgi:hypothetical protein